LGYSGSNFCAESSRLPVEWVDDNEEGGREDVFILNLYSSNKERFQMICKLPKDDQHFIFFIVVFVFQ